MFEFENESSPLKTEEDFHNKIRSRLILEILGKDKTAASSGNETIKRLKKS